MNTKSIAQIKQLFQQNKVTEEIISSLRKDERKGVQQLLRSYDRKQEQLEKDRAQFIKMTQFDRAYKTDEHTLLAGIDEAGRGPLAGPVVSAAVILPATFECIGLTDSKVLTEEKRQEFYDYIIEQAIDYHIAIIDNEKIDRINILEATKQSMQQAIEQLHPTPEVTLIDAVELVSHVTNTVAITKGDQKSISIAAASILAKVARDRLMVEIDEQYPQYDFKNNKGYGSKKHLAALEEYGASPFHRVSFSPVQKAIAMSNK